MFTISAMLQYVKVSYTNRNEYCSSQLYKVNSSGNSDNSHSFISHYNMTTITINYKHMFTQYHTQLYNYPSISKLVDHTTEQLLNELIRSRYQLNVLYSKTLIIIDTIKSQNNTMATVSNAGELDIRSIEAELAVECENIIHQVYQSAIQYITQSIHSNTIIHYNDSDDVSMQSDTHIPLAQANVSDEIKNKYKIRKHKSFPAIATVILNEFYNQCAENAYPDCQTKIKLAEQCGITYDQLQHWLINRRMRSKQPGAIRRKRGRIPNKAYHRDYSDDSE